MKYQGKELTKFKSDNNVAFNPSKDMIVWDDEESKCRKTKVLAYTSGISFPVITLTGTPYRFCAEIPKGKTNWDTFQQRYGTEKIDVNDAITKFIYSRMRCDFCPAKQQCSNLHTGDLEACVDTFKAWATAEYKETNEIPWNRTDRV